MRIISSFLNPPALKPIAQSVADVGNVGAGVQTLVTLTLPAGSLLVAGNGLLLRAWGDVANNANAKSVQIEQALIDSGFFTPTAGAAREWFGEMMLLKSAANAQKGYVNYRSMTTVGAALDKAFNLSLVHGVNDSAPMDFQIRVIGTNNNDVRCFGAALFAF